MELFPIRPLSLSIQIKVLSGFTMCIVWERGRLMGFKPLNHSQQDAKAIADGTWKGLR